MRRLSSLVLALVLLLGQAALLAHEYDFAAHKDGSSCSICLHATPLTDAAVGSFSLELPSVDGATDFQPIELQQTSTANNRYCARAPPISHPL